MREFELRQTLACDERQAPAGARLSRISLPHPSRSGILVCIQGIDLASFGVDALRGRPWALTEQLDNADEGRLVVAAPREAVDEDGGGPR